MRVTTEGLEAHPGAVDLPAEMPAEALVRTVHDVASSCPCAGAAQVAVLRRFGGPSRQLARAVRHALAGLGEVTVHDEPVPVVVVSRPLDHVCVYVDAAGPSTEAGRLAALTRTPLVRFAPETGLSQTTRATPVLRLNHPARPFPSADGHVVDVAFKDLLVRPNQPEAGDLEIRVGEHPWRPLPRGASITARALPDAVLVEVTAPHRQQARWLTMHLSVRRVDGLFPVIRDDLCVTDLADVLTIDHETDSLVEHFL